MASEKRILVVAGDISGDVHAANLITALKILAPEIKIDTIGGLRMKALSDNYLYDLITKGAAGFDAVIKKLPTWLNLYKLVKNYLKETKPAAVITVDFYGFNHQILKLAKAENIPAYYYVCPQVWASRRYRAKEVVRLTRKQFVIFPFEADIYKEYGGNPVFFGNPLLDTVPEPLEISYKKGKDAAWNFGLMVGSRPAEIEKHSKIFFDVFKEIKKVYKNAKCFMFAVPEVTDEKLYQLTGASKEEMQIVREKDFKIRRNMDFVLTCSGTATLENALLGLPMSVVYKTSFITYAIVRMIIKVRFISLVNILSNKEVVREFIQGDVSPQTISKEILGILGDENKYLNMRKTMLELRNKLGAPPVAKQSAQVILEDLCKTN